MIVCNTPFVQLQGRLLQVEYALEATHRGHGVVAAAGADCVVIASRDLAMPSSPRACPSTVIWKIDDHLAIAATGYV
jgi:20S proteasome alpha/beta subunit